MGCYFKRESFIPVLKKISEQFAFFHWKQNITILNKEIILLIFPDQFKYNVLRNEASVLSNSFVLIFFYKIGLFSAIRKSNKGTTCSRAPIWQHNNTGL